MTCTSRSSHNLGSLQIQPSHLRPSKLIHVELALIPLALFLPSLLLGLMNLILSSQPREWFFVFVFALA